MHGTKILYSANSQWTGCPPQQTGNSTAVSQEMIPLTTPPEIIINEIIPEVSNPPIKTNLHTQRPDTVTKRLGRHKTPQNTTYSQILRKTPEEMRNIMFCNCLPCRTIL